MSTRSQLTKDLNESVKTLLGKQLKILFKNVVRLETKGDKTENKVLVFSPCRILMLTAKVPTRIDCHYHYLDIQGLESKRGNQLCLTFNDKTYSFLTGDDSTSSQEVDSMISALATAIRNIFPTVSLHYIIKKIEVIPTSRLQVLRDIEAVGSNIREVGPCGGFSSQYACMCDFHNMPYREEVAWDVDNIYVSLNTRELCLKDFDHLDQKDLVPIISALEYNTWFTRLRVNHVKLSHDIMDKLLNVLRKSLSLEELFFDNLALKSDILNKLTNVIKGNRIIPLHTVDLSNNPIEDKGAISLGSCIAELNRGLTHLNISRCGITAKGINQLANLIVGKSSLYNTLTYLNFSENNLKDDISNLYTFLSHPNAISYLDLSGSDIILENLFVALVKGCTTNLVHLNVSRNPYNTKKTKEAPIAFKQFFSTTLNLKYLNMAHCKLPQEALKNLLLGLACNEFTKEITLDLSFNCLGNHGAHVIESCIHGVRCISSLDISENNMDVDLAQVVTAISKNKSLRHLSMGRNMLNMKAKHVSIVMDAVVQIIQDEECVLKSLNISDCKLKSDLHNFFNALGNNKCLETIDISGNMIGDSGARLLAKALQVNTKLKSIYYDRNNITLQGYLDIAYSLESNKTVQYMPFPIHDITPYMKNSGEKADLIMRKIQDLLHRNVSPRKSNNIKKNHVIQPEFSLSSKQHAVDRLTNQTVDIIKNLSADSNVNSSDITRANSIMKDAESCKKLFAALQEVSVQKDEVHPVKVKLQQISGDIHATLNEYLQCIVDRMLKSSKDLLPFVLGDEHILQDIKRDCKNKKHIPLEFVVNCIKHQAGTDIMNKLGELNLIIASYVSEKITDEVFEALMRSYKILLGDNTVIKIDSPPRRSRLSSSDSSKHGTSDISITDSGHHSDHSPLKLEYLNLATPHLSIKRKSLHGRKMRPKSVVDSVEGLSADDIPSLMPNMPIRHEEDDSVTELPGAIYQLQHLVKGRPRRAKTRAPTRSLLRPSDALDSINSPDLKEGLDTFFRPGSVTPTSEEPSRISDSPTFAVFNDEKKTPKKAIPLTSLTSIQRSQSSSNIEDDKSSTASGPLLDSPSPGQSAEQQESSESELLDSMPSKSNSTDGKDEEVKKPTKLSPGSFSKPRPWSLINNTDSISCGDNLLSDGSSPILLTPDYIDGDSDKSQKDKKTGDGN